MRYVFYFLMLVILLFIAYELYVIDRHLYVIDEHLIIVSDFFDFYMTELRQIKAL